MNKPFAHATADQSGCIPKSSVMLDCVIALIPAVIASVILFGLKALLMILTCVFCSLISELIFDLCIKKKSTLGDLSAVVTGLILALSLSTRVELWQCAIGAVFATVVVKCLFGGLGKNIVNPAAAARVLMLLTFSSVLNGAAISPLFDLSFLGKALPELSAGASPLAYLAEGSGNAGAPDLLTLLLGTHAGAIGETCAIALLIGFVYLVCRKAIKWYVPVAYVATVFVCCIISGGFDLEFALSHVLSGGLLFGAIFMATDSVTTPRSPSGRVIFCIGAGLLTFALRKFGAYAEGVAIAILTMNLLTPFINDLTEKSSKGGKKQCT